jgi:SAM-dependent methyltransferase
LPPPHPQGKQRGMEPAEYALMDAAEDCMWWYRALHARLLDSVADRTGSLLDAGCGTGGFLAAVRTNRPDLRLFGVEWAEAAAKRASAKSGARIVRGSVNELPFAEASFDIAVSADVLCHGSVDPSKALGELRRVLRPGGRVVINMPAFGWLMSAHDRRVHNTRRQTARETAAMLSAAGFRNVRSRYWNGILLPLMVLQRKLFSRGDAASDVAVFPPWQDRTLHAMTVVERRLAVPVPAGGSILATAENP